MRTSRKEGAAEEWRQRVRWEWLMRAASRLPDSTADDFQKLVVMALAEEKRGSLALAFVTAGIQKPAI